MNGAYTKVSIEQPKRKPDINLKKSDKHQRRGWETKAAKPMESFWYAQLRSKRLTEMSKNKDQESEKRKRSSAIEL